MNIPQNDNQEIKLALVEDNPQMSQSLTDAVEKESRVVLTGVAYTFQQGLELLNHAPADVLLIDLGLPDGNGINLIKSARSLWPNCAIMVFTVFGDEENILNCIKAGANGYLLKDCPPDQVIQEIFSLHAGGSPISPMVARLILKMIPKNIANEAVTALRSPNDIELSSRETEVLQLMTKGFNYVEVAKKLEVSPHTVRTFVRRIYTKLEVNSKVAAINKARTKGIL